MEVQKRQRIIPIFVPHKGCPYDCIFCNQKKISGQIAELSEIEIAQTIENYLKTIKDSDNVQIAFYGGSFTGIEPSKQRTMLAAAHQYILKGFADSIRISTRPDYISDEILLLLKDYSVKTIELGVQSLDEEVLRLSCRGHSAEQVYRSAELIKQYGFILGLQMMTGLPGDSREKIMKTAEGFTSMKPEVVRIYPALVIKDTYMEKMYRDGRYKPFTLEESVEICAGLLEFFNSKNINVIRLGLQATENISEGGDVVAGPFHPAFRELVEARIQRRKVDSVLENQNDNKGNSIMIRVNPREISITVGQKKCNIDYWKKKFLLKEIKVIGDSTLKKGDIHCRNLSKYSFYCDK